MIERFVDYLQMNVQLSERTFTDTEFDVISAIRFYKRGYRNVNGVRFYFGNPNSDKCSVVMSGFALLFERLNFENDAAMIDFWLKRGATVSRLDLAVTDWIDNDFVTVKDVKKWFKKNLIESPFVDGGCKMISEVLPESPDVPQTLYIGDIEKRGKRGIFRAYDKGLELGIDKFLATRIEVELKHENAHSTAKRIAQTNDISGNFRAKFNVNSVQFERLMDAPIADTTRGASLPKEERDTEMNRRWKWLLETVAPALREAVKYDRKFDNLDANLTKFLIRAGISEDVKHHVKLLTDRMISDYTDTIDLLDTSD